VLPNGDLYPGEGSVGSRRWRLGNVLDDANIKWELLDVIAEVRSASLQAVECTQCPWRYRCGGLNAWAGTLHQNPGPEQGCHWRDLYCLPRKRLFEELLWQSANSVASGVGQGKKELLELKPDGITFAPDGGLAVEARL
jgi:radical SAM protein with 4Fe4S-binding SPASM domain